MVGSVLFPFYYNFEEALITFSAQDRNSSFFFSVAVTLEWSFVYSNKNLLILIEEKWN